MFPVSFAQRIIEEHSNVGDMVLDPFCGRGTTPFVAKSMGRNAVGIDVNPVGWIFAKVKTDPYHNTEKLLVRLRELLSSVLPVDAKAETDFQKYAWSPNVLAFLNVARRDLSWRTVKLDRTLMALILVHLHAKLGEGLSNQMRQSKAMAPEYAVRWWSSRGMAPPEIDIVDFFRKKFAWRYAQGIPKSSSLARVYLGDAKSFKADRLTQKASLILTSPPYCGVTNYEYDNWIRLWMLGGPSHPCGSARARYGNRADYRKLIFGVLKKCQHLSLADARIYVRTGASDFDTEVAVEAIQKLWPKHKISMSFDRPLGPTQTALYGHDWLQQGEMDILATPSCH